jgi:Tol biopolymer transport system component
MSSATATSPTAPTGEIVYSVTVPAPRAYGIGEGKTRGTPLPFPVNNIGKAGISYDGTHVAYSEPGEYGILPRSTLFVTSTDGHGTHTIWKFAGEPTGPPAWNHAGAAIAMTVQADTTPASTPEGGSIAPGLWIIPLTGGRPNRVASTAYGSVAWSPNGKTIAYTTTYAAEPVYVRTVPVSGGPSHQIATLTIPDPTSELFTTLSWSPNGKTILTDSYGIKVVPASSSTKGPYFNHSKIEQIPSTGGKPVILLPVTPYRYYTNATYSPDGSQFVYITGTLPPGDVDKTRANTHVSFELDITNSSGSDTRRLISVTSSSGSQIIGWVKNLK